MVDNAPLPPAAQTLLENRAARAIQRAYGEYKENARRNEAATNIQRVFRGHAYGRHFYRNPYNDDWITRPKVSRQTLSNLTSFMGVRDMPNNEAYHRWLKWRRKVTKDMAEFPSWTKDRQEAPQYMAGFAPGSAFYRYPTAAQLGNEDLALFNRTAALRSYTHHLKNRNAVSGRSPPRFKVPVLDAEMSQKFRSPPRRVGKHEDFRLPNPNSPLVFRARQMKVPSPASLRAEKLAAADFVRASKNADRLAAHRILPVHASPRTRYQYTRQSAVAQRPAILRRVLLKHAVRRPARPWVSREMMKSSIGVGDSRDSRKAYREYRRKIVHDAKLAMRRIGGLATPMRSHVQSFLPRPVRQSVPIVRRRVLKAKPPSGMGYQKAPALYSRTVPMRPMKRTRAGTFKPYTVKGARGAPYTITDEKDSGYYRVGNKIMGTYIR